MNVFEIFLISFNSLQFENSARYTVPTGGLNVNSAILISYVPVLIR